MFRAIGRWIKAVGYLLTGQIDSARRTLDTNPHVVRSKYEEIIREKTTRIHQYKQAVAGLIAQQENKLGKVKSLSDEVGKLERLKAGALAKAKMSVEKLKATGMTMEQIKTDEDYKKCLSAYSDFSSTLAEKQERIEELERDIEEYRNRIGDHKVQLQSLLRDLDGLRAEASDAVADMITAKEEKDIADTISGIAKDGTAQELQRMRQLRQEVKAEARISKELAGTDSRAQEAEFLEYARQTEGSNEFDALIGLADAADTTPAAPEADESERTSLPE
jgi:phage shock protein A